MHKFIDALFCFVFVFIYLFSCLYNLLDHFVNNPAIVYIIYVIYKCLNKVYYDVDR